MRYKIFSLNQEQLVENGISVEEALLLDYILTFKSNEKMKRYFDEELQAVGYWVSYDAIINDLPILFKQMPAGASEEDAEKNIKANKAKIARMFKGLNKVLCLKKKVKKGKNGLGSEMYVFFNTEIVKSLEAGKPAEVEDPAVDQVETVKDPVADHKPKEIIKPKLVNTSLRIMAIENLRSRGVKFWDYDEAMQECLIEQEMDEISRKMVI